MFDPWHSALAWMEVVADTHAESARWQQHQFERLNALLRAATQGSPWWRERLDRIGPARAVPHDAADLLRLLPVSRKRELMDRFPDWVTDPALDLAALRAFAADTALQGQSYLGRALVWESSGSSGEPALFVQDAQSLAVSDAIEATLGPATLSGRDGMTSFASPGTRTAFVGAIDGPFATIVSLQRLRALNPWVAASSRAFSFLQPAATLVEELERWQPTVLATYPSMAWILAQEKAAGHLRCAPEAVSTGGETLTPVLQRAIDKAFGCPVRNSYGASECMAIANECRSGALHLNVDWVMLEPVDAQFRPVPQGEVGSTTLLTNLANHLQPIIRYDLGDRVRFVPGRCDCGCTMPRLEVEGRCDEVLTLDDARGQHVHLSPLALATVLEDDAGVFDFCLMQCGPQALRLDLCGRERADPEARSRAADALQSFLRQQGLSGVKLTVRAASVAERGRSGKLRRVWCEPRVAPLKARATPSKKASAAAQSPRATARGRAPTTAKRARAARRVARR